MTTLQTTPRMIQRGPSTQPRRTPVQQINLGQSERWATGLGGIVLAGLGVGLSFARRSPLGAILSVAGGAMAYRAVSGYCPMYKALGINHAAGEGRAAPSEYFERGIHVDSAVTINRPPEEIYAFWRNLENLPRFMRHLHAVHPIDETRSHWVAAAPAGSSVEWDAQIINDEPNALIAWRSLENADVDNSGSVRFLPAPGNRGTEIHVSLEYLPPAGKLGAAVAALFGRSPRQQIDSDLRRLKQILEAGEMPTTLGQPRGKCS